MRGDSGVGDTRARLEKLKKGERAQKLEIPK